MAETTSLSVTVPDGIKAGGLFLVSTPTGEMVQVTCPAGAAAGQIIRVDVPTTGSTAGGPAPSQRPRFGGMFSLRAQKPAASPQIPAVAPQAVASSVLEVEVVHGLAMPEAHPQSAAQLQQQEMLDAMDAGEEVAAKARPQRVTHQTTGGDADRASRASRAGRVSRASRRMSAGADDDVPPFLASCAPCPNARP